MNLSLKFFAAFCLLMIGVFIGIHSAEKGMEKVQSATTDKAQVQYITKIDKGKVEQATVRQGSNGKTTNEKPYGNFVSQSGNTLGGWIKDTVKISVGWLTGFFQP